MVDLKKKALEMSKSDIEKLKLVKNGNIGLLSMVYRLNDDECVAVSDVERISQKTCDLLNELYNVLGCLAKMV